MPPPPAAAIRAGVSARRSSIPAQAYEPHIRTFTAADTAAMVTFFEALSQTARFYRFHSGFSKLPSSIVRSIGEIDQANHIALVAVQTRVVGEARCVRMLTEPRCAELALAVSDAEQRRGVGRRLLRTLACRAAECGIETFTADVLCENRKMIDMLVRRGAEQVSRQGPVASFRLAVAACINFQA